MKKPWYEYMWIISVLYLILGFFNILFAWLGMFCFIIPLLISVIKGNKSYCNKYCGRGQMLTWLGKKIGISRKKPMPRWMTKKWFRYGFLAFFMIMFAQMIFVTFLVFKDVRGLSETVKLLWTFKIPWSFAYKVTGLPLWISQFAFGFYSVMLTSTILGIITNILFKPRSWCIYCPMGTMTQLICEIKDKS
ncbi:MAG: 4Fe-4S binding protein [Clostridiales bacterium]|nr:4Fe-4S binding protein [Clostridiales bacterium]